jgi:hypothetical protein
MDSITTEMGLKTARTRTVKVSGVPRKSFVRYLKPHVMTGLIMTGTGMQIVEIPIVPAHQTVIQKRYAMII